MKKEGGFLSESKYTSQQKHIRNNYVRFGLDLTPEILANFKEKCQANGTTPTTEIKKFIAEYVKTNWLTQKKERPKIPASPFSYFPTIHTPGKPSPK